MQVEHDDQEMRFFVRGESEDAELRYTRPRPGVLDLQHTFVPGELRGRGIADALAETAFGHARENGLKVLATCEFVRKWLGRHEEQRDLVVTE